MAGMAGTPLAAQRPGAPTGADSVPHAVAIALPRGERGHPIRWYEVGVAAAIVGGSMALDQPLERSLQRHRSSGKDDVASVFRRVGQPEVYGTVSLGLLGAGLLTGNHELARAGGRAVGSLVLATVWMGGGKLVFGRARPYASPDDAFQFHPFRGGEANQSFPSGHVTEAFTLATSLADDIHSTPVQAGLYLVAAGTAWSRLNDDKHWLSDTVLGALVGITSAKLMDGHWRIFHLRPPRILLSPDAVGVEASASF